MIGDAIKRGLATKPDVICLTGDFVSGPGDTPAPREYARVLRRLSAAAPTFAVLGNHDGGSWAAKRLGWSDHRLVDHVLGDSGIELLHNRSRVVEVRGQKLGLVGVGDQWSEEVDADRAFQGTDPRMPSILLAHNPDTKELCAAHSWDVMLSGHTHGGQIVVPFYGTPFRPVEDTRYLAGLKYWGSRQIHVTRGVGNLLGVRLNCRPEVSVLEVG
jgi:predicted MPP superfamily phosphohydrolase